MAAGQIHDGGLSGGDDELGEDLVQRQGALRHFRHAVRPRAQNDAGAVPEFPGIAQLGEHTVQTIGLFPNVLQKQDFAFGVNFPGRAEGRCQQGQIAAAEDAFRLTRNQRADALAFRIGKRAVQTTKQGLFQIAEGVRIRVRLGRWHGAVEGGETADLIQKQVQGGDVGIAAEPLGVLPDSVRVQQGENAVAAVAAADAPHAVNGFVGKGAVDVLRPLGVRRGQIAVPVGKIAGGVQHRLHAQPTDEVKSAGQFFLRHGGGGGDQRHSGAGEKGLGIDHGRHLEKKYGASRTHTRALLAECQNCLRYSSSSGSLARTKWPGTISHQSGWFVSL